MLCVTLKLCFKLNTAETDNFLIVVICIEGQVIILKPSALSALQVTHKLNKISLSALGVNIQHLFGKLVCTRPLTVFKEQKGSL